MFTDTKNLLGNGTNDDTDGTAIAGGVDIAITKLYGHTLLGEVMVEYAKFSDKRVLQTTSAILANDGAGSPEVKKVTVSELNVVIAPKYRFELGKFRPWIIPAGLSFLVNSPPSDSATYLDTGFHYGVGAEYMLTDLLSIGIDYRNTIASGDPGFEATYYTAGAYVGFNF